MPDEIKKSAIDEFLSDIPVAGDNKSEDVFNQNLNPEVKVPEKEREPEPRKNREHRRLEAKYQAEREANIALNARLESLSESDKFARDTNSGNIPEKLKQLYGTDERGTMAAKLTAEVLDEYREQAKKEALEALESQREQEAQEVSSYREELDSYLEGIEDEFDVDLTSDTPTALKMRQGFFSLLSKVSPKNKDGVVTDYADPIATWELFQQSQKPEPNRAKDLGSRSMVRSGSSGDSKLEQSAQERFLKEAGII